ncbi:MAG: hypothetical protein AAF830_14095 [Pseudomonadota bacterium]
MSRSVKPRAIAALAGWAFALPHGGYAQTTEEVSQDEIIVKGRVLSGRTLADVEPELVLDEDDIAAYGVSSIADLLAILTASTSTGRGREEEEPPVVLVNGRRVSGFREIGRYPTEAIARVEIFPEEVALSYGFSASQRVVNFVLKDNTRIRAVEALVGAPSRGGSTFTSASVQQLTVNGNQRRSLDAQGRRDPEILESERNLGSSDGDLRTLTPDRDTWSAGFSLGRGLKNEGVATLSGSYEDTDERALLGQSDDGGSFFVQDSRSKDFVVGASAASRLAPRTWTLTAEASRRERMISTRTISTEAGGSQPEQRDESTTTNLTFDGVINDRSITLGGGKLALTGQAGGRWEQLEQRDGERERLSSQRSTGTLRGNISVPISWWRAIPGQLSLNANGQADFLSDVGTIGSVGGGLNWKIGSRTQLLASYTAEEGAPTLAQLTAPEVVTPGVRIFDAAQANDTIATVIDGGNAALTPDVRQVLKFGVQIKPWLERDNQFNVEYTQSSVDGETRTFAFLTDEFEQAFPDRVQRSVDGELISFDRRSVQVDLSERQQLRSSLTLKWEIPARVVKGGLSAAAAKRRGGRPGAAQALIVHRWTLEDQAEAPGGVVFDFLNGSAASNFGGTPEHRVDAILYRWNEGIGFFGYVRWQAATFTDGPLGRVEYDDLVGADARLTYEFNYASDRVIERLPFLKETRLTMAVDNVFDLRQTVRDQNSETPVALRPDLLDPLGRTFRVELRKRF